MGFGVVQVEGRGPGGCYNRTGRRGGLLESFNGDITDVNTRPSTIYFFPSLRLI